MTSLTGAKPTLWITGACGTLGLRLVPMLSLAGYSLRLWGQDQKALNSFSNPIVTGPWKTARLDWERRVSGTENVLIHLAAMASARACVEDPKLAYETNVELTNQVTRFAIDHDFSKVVLSSTGLIYGTSFSRPATETQEAKPFDVYTKTKVEAEQVIEGLSQKTRGISLRFSNLYGPTSRPETVFGRLLQEKDSTAPLSIHTLAPTRDFLFIDDALTAIQKTISAALAPGFHSFNISTGVATRVKVLVDTFLRATHPREILETNPSSDPNYNVLDPSKAAIVLGFSPTTDLEAGIRKSIDSRNS